MQQVVVQGAGKTKDMIDVFIFYLLLTKVLHLPCDWCCADDHTGTTEPYEPRPDIADLAPGTRTDRRGQEWLYLCWLMLVVYG